MIGNILSPTHLLLVLGVALLFLGPKRLPEVGRGLGSAIRDFKGSLSGTGLTDERPPPQLSERARSRARCVARRSVGYVAVRGGRRAIGPATGWAATATAVDRKPNDLFGETRCHGQVRGLDQASSVATRADFARAASGLAGWGFVRRR